ncbi:unnamed protein product [Euphydryas editha]|uniref:Uncharacterized protein n=1 Tax=Euphydryas editha TaxID=104508 RepID=A0AAU9V2E1_EUPED|nr:unnamed protein product [Euphydryas editha]
MGLMPSPFHCKAKQGRIRRSHDDRVGALRRDAAPSPATSAPVQALFNPSMAPKSLPKDRNKNIDWLKDGEDLGPFQEQSRGSLERLLRISILDFRMNQFIGNIIFTYRLLIEQLSFVF